MWRTRHTSPEEDPKATFFLSRRRNKDTAELENRDALRTGADVAGKGAAQSGYQAWSQGYMIFAEGIAQLDCLFAGGEQSARNQFGSAHFDKPAATSRSRKPDSRSCERSAGLAGVNRLRSAPSIF